MILKGATCLRFTIYWSELDCNLEFNPSIQISFFFFFLSTSLRSMKFQSVQTFLSNWPAKLFIISLLQNKCFIHLFTLAVGHSWLSSCEYTWKVTLLVSALLSQRNFALAALKPGCQHSTTPIRCTSATLRSRKIISFNPIKRRQLDDLSRNRLLAEYVYSSALTASLLRHCDDASLLCRSRQTTVFSKLQERFQKGRRWISWCVFRQRYKCSELVVMKAESLFAYIRLIVDTYRLRNNQINLFFVSSSSSKFHPFRMRRKLSMMRVVVVALLIAVRRKWINIFSGQSTLAVSLIHLVRQCRASMSHLSSNLINLSDSRVILVYISSLA